MNMDVEDFVWEDADWMHLKQDNDKQRALVNMIRQVS
jgi:hypothetical protein